MARDFTLRMTWRKKHPTVDRLAGDYTASIRVSKRDMKPYEDRLERSATLPRSTTSRSDRSACGW